jgi:Na+-driven multidrug efflux pump
MCVITGGVWAITTLFLLTIFKRPFFGIFSNDDTVISLLNQAFPVMIIYCFIDCVQCIGQGIIRGLGQQLKASVGTVIGYWVIGIPVSLLTVFNFKWGISGLWMGPTLGIAFNFFFYYYLVLKTDWQKIATAAKERRELEMRK